MRKLIEARYPVYAEADITVESRDVPHELIVDAVIDALGAKLGCKAKPAAQGREAGPPQERAMMERDRHIRPRRLRGRRQGGAKGQQLPGLYRRMA